MTAADNAPANNAPANNADERQRWNDARRTSFWPRREPFTDCVTPHLLDAAALRPGEQVLDIGSGGGRTAIAAGRIVGAAGRVVGAAGRVVGADISIALCDLARQRARAAGVDNVRFDVVDMQTASVAGRPFDVAMSQFGVMFFDDPVAAFANIAHHLRPSGLRPSGRLVFACWQSADRNPWQVGPALAEYVPAVPPPAAGKSPTGPFALADPERTTGILRAAGFSEIERTAVEFTVDLTEDAVIDDDQIAFMGVAAADMPAAHAAIDRQLAQFRLGTGESRFPLALQIFSARPA
jgi:ubiquinone/menaquinone biosynthesis C-methylase UbiE